MKVLDEACESSNLNKRTRRLKVYFKNIKYLQIYKCNDLKIMKNDLFSNYIDFKSIQSIWQRLSPDYFKNNKATEDDNFQFHCS